MEINVKQQVLFFLFLSKGKIREEKKISVLSAISVGQKISVEKSQRARSASPFPYFPSFPSFP